MHRQQDQLRKSQLSLAQSLSILGELRDLTNQHQQMFARLQELSDMQAEINESVQRLVAAGESQTYKYESLLHQL